MALIEHKHDGERSFDVFQHIEEEHGAKPDNFRDLADAVGWHEEQHEQVLYRIEAIFEVYASCEDIAISIVEGAGNPFDYLTEITAEKVEEER